MRFKSQVTRDQSRESYLVTFPADLDAERVLAWLRSISGTLPKRSGSALSKDTLVFETWATSAGITHRLLIPKNSAEYIAAQLRTHGRGITVTKDESRPTIEWTAGVEVGMSSPLRQLRIKKHSDLAASLLGSVQALQGDEVVMMQWVVTPAKFERMPSRDHYTSSADFKMHRALLSGPAEAGNDELNDRRQKLEEQNLLGIGRVLSKAESTKRSEELVLRVESALSAANSSANYFKSRPGNRKLIDQANEAASVMLFPAQFSLTELAGVIAWPIGSPFVAGLPKGSTRHVFATEDVPTEGRVLGDSNYPGHERAIALGYEYATQHMIVTGGSGTGKTVLLANCFAQDVAAGYGAIVIDASNSESSETMFQRSLLYIPQERMQDVIVMDIQADRLNPVGFNILDQGNPHVVADQVTELLTHLYSDTAGIWTKQLLFYGVNTLALKKGLTLADIVILLNPTTKEEKAWADELIASVKDRDTRDFWTRWKAFSQPDRDRYTQPLLNRIWQLISRPEVRDIISQSESSFQIKDVINENKILLVNLAGLPPETSSILGTLLVNAIWSAAQSLRPEKPNFMYLDEFQVMTEKLPLGLEDLLSRARKHNLGLAMATQFLEQIPAEVKRSAINNARTKIVYRVASQEARTWQSEFGKALEADDFMRVNPYEVVAHVASASGSTPVTMRTRPPLKATGYTRAVREMSRAVYGRPIATVEEERYSRRTAEHKKSSKRPSIDAREWGK